MNIKLAIIVLNKAKYLKLPPLFMLTSIKHKALKTTAIGYLWLSGIPLAQASQNLFGPTPEIGQNDIRGTTTKVVKSILNYMALAAVVVIVIAGIRMVISQGEQESVEKSKKTILFAIIGLVVILLARGIVEIITTIL